jgi:hypothetical protein
MVLAAFIGIRGRLRRKYRYQASRQARNNNNFYPNELKKCPTEPNLQSFKS